MQEAGEMMSKLQDKPLINRVSDMTPISPPQPYLPEGLMPTILQSGPDRMATPRGPHQLIDKFHRERTLDEVRTHARAPVLDHVVTLALCTSSLVCCNAFAVIGKNSEPHEPLMVCY